jgi:hypothetical protein
MSGKHCRNHTRRREAVSVAPVHDSANWRAAKAIFANSSVAKKLAVYACKPIVSQGLDDCGAGIARGPMDGGRQLGKEILDVNEIDSTIPYDVRDLSRAIARPYGVDGSRYPGALHVPIVDLIKRAIDPRRT